MTATFLGRVRGDWMGKTCLGSLCPRLLLLLFILLDRSLSTGAAPTLVHSFVTISQIALTIAYLSIVVFNLCYWPALTVFCALRHALLANYQSSVMEQSVHA